MSPKNVMQLTYKYYCCLGFFFKLSWYLNYLKLLFQSNTIILFKLKENLTNKDIFCSQKSTVVKVLSITLNIYRQEA